MTALNIYNTIIDLAMNRVTSSDVVCNWADDISSSTEIQIYKCMFQYINTTDNVCLRVLGVYNSRYGWHINNIYYDSIDDDCDEFGFIPRELKYIVEKFRLYLNDSYIIWKLKHG
jgi:hypothetical protein